MSKNNFRASEAHLQRIIFNVSKRIKLVKESGTIPFVALEKANVFE